jgi:RNA polymerase sigma-70 factor (ECF subfamily)
MAGLQHSVDYRNPEADRPGPAVMSDTDEALAARAASDPAAFAEIHRRYVDRIYRYCARRLRTEDGIEDATSQIFLQALEGLHRTRVANLAPWLFTIAHNVVTDWYRERRQDVELDAAQELPSGGSSPEETVLARSAAIELREALAHLTQDQRRVVELRLAGLTGPEIRLALGKSRSWVDTTQFRALKRLRELLTAPDTARKR